MREQRLDECRREYMVRVAIEYLTKHDKSCSTIVYDDAECDGWCIADDLLCAFDLDVEDN